MSAANDNLFNPTDRMLRQFAAIAIVFFGAIAARQEFHHHRHGLAIVFAVLAATIGPLGLAWPRVIKPVFIGWMALAYPIGWTVSRIVLGVIFYGLFTPMAAERGGTVAVSSSILSHTQGTIMNTETSFEKIARSGSESSFIGELWALLRKKKKFWLIPIIFMLLLLGVLVFFSTTAAAPFIYTLF